MPSWVGLGEGEQPPLGQAVGCCRQQQLGGYEPDGAEDGVDDVEGLLDGLEIVQCVSGGESEAGDVAVVAAGTSYLEADKVDAGGPDAVVVGEMSGVVAGAAAEFKDSLSVKFGAE